MEGPLFPKVEVQLSGQDGNVFLMIAKVKTAMKQSGECEKADIQAFQTEVLAAGSYDEAIQIIMRWVSVL